jgi:purine-cytosine permease-like protein
MKRTIISLVLTVIILLILSAVSQAMDVNAGGVNYVFAPLAVKVSSCGSGNPTFKYCTHPLIWWGIAFSVLIAISIFTGIYNFRKSKLIKLLLVLFIILVPIISLYTAEGHSRAVWCEVHSRIPNSTYTYDCNS